MKTIAITLIAAAVTATAQEVHTVPASTFTCPPMPRGAQIVNTESGVILRGVVEIPLTAEQTAAVCGNIAATNLAIGSRILKTESGDFRVELKTK